MCFGSKQNDSGKAASDNGPNTVLSNAREVPDLDNVAKPLVRLAVLWREMFCDNLGF
jgi:hypothetical protein